MSAGDQQQPQAGETVADSTAESRHAHTAERDRARQERRQPGEAPSMDEADRANGEPGAQD